LLVVATKWGLFHLTSYWPRHECLLLYSICVNFQAPLTSYGWTENVSPLQSKSDHESTKGLIPWTHGLVAMQTMPVSTHFSLTMETARSSETMVSYHIIIRRHNQEKKTLMCT
jgi:hypothetical protein